MENKICKICGRPITKAKARVFCGKECRIIDTDNKRKKFVEHGFCRDCHKREVVPGRLMCRECLDKGAERRRKKAEKDPGFYMYHNAKSRSTELRLKFNLEKDDIKVPDYCPVLGIKLEKSGKHINENSPTLDKIVPSLGYVKGNVCVMSQRANRLKNDASIDELILLGEWAKKIREQK
jgi:hypothetical protein